MRAKHLRYALIISLMTIIAVSTCSTDAGDGQWIPNGIEYATYFEALGAHSFWTFNTTRGPNDRWGINFTISGFGFQTTPLIICDEFEYQQWTQTGATNQCHFVRSVDYSLHTTVNLSHQSRWYCILINTSPVTLFFSLRLTHYRWTSENPPTTTDIIEGISSLFVYLILIGLIVFVIIPCVCRFSCFRFFRHRTNKNSQSKQGHTPTIIVVTSQEPVNHYAEDEDY